MQEQFSKESSNASETEGIWLVVYDVDLTLTVHHTGGDTTRKSFEKPLWRNNLRCIDSLRLHLFKMKQHCHLAFGTYGWWQERLDAYRDELWLKEDELLMHAELVNKQKYPKRGKNKHIVSCILQHYQDPNAKKILGVLLVEDSQHNIKCLQYYDQYIKAKHNNNPLLQVEINSILMPPASIIKKNNACGTVETDETFYSKYAFETKLKEIERLMIPEICVTVADQISEQNEKSEEQDSVESESISSSSEDTPLFFSRPRLTQSGNYSREHKKEHALSPLPNQRNKLVSSR